MAIHYELAEPARLDPAVYDVRGRVVRRLAAGLLAADGEHHVIWDGLDERGGPVGRGVYFVRIGGTGNGGAAPDPR